MKKFFGYKVYKVSIDAGFSCPNRDNTKDSSGCIFCDATGSSSRTNPQGTPIKDQIINNINVRQKRYRAKKFIAYFQSFSNTYAPISTLKKLYDEAISSHKDIIGLSISTRSDCLDEEKIKLIASYKKKLQYVCVELGLQSIHNKTLKLINRKETFEDFLKALSLCKKYNLTHCVHVILNLPGETKEMQLQTAEKLSQLKVDGIKIHPLVIMKNTPLEILYKKKLYIPLSLSEYISLACDFLEKIHKNCIIHRLSASGHPLHNVAPLWSKEKNLNIADMISKEFLKRTTEQGIKITQAYETQDQIP